MTISLVHALGLVLVVGLAAFGAGMYFKSKLIQKAKDALGKAS